MSIKSLVKAVSSKKTVFYGIVNLALLAMASPVWAAATGAITADTQWSHAAKVISGALVLGWGAFGSAVGISKFGAACLEGMTRQPEVQGKIFTSMLIGMAFIEALCLYCLVIALILVS